MSAVGSIDLKPASPHDAHDIARIHVASWQSAYVDLLPQSYLDGLDVGVRRNMWFESLTAGRPEVWIASAGGRPVGWVAFDASRDRAPENDTRAHHAGEIWALYVLASEWSWGVGRSLCNKACERLAARGFTFAMLWVFENNERARHFYEKAGFELDLGSAKAFEIAGIQASEVRYCKTLPVLPVDSA